MVATKVGSSFTLLAIVFGAWANTASSSIKGTNSPGSMSLKLMAVAPAISARSGFSIQIAQATSSPLNVPPSVPTLPPSYSNPSSGAFYNSPSVQQPYGQGFPASPYNGAISGQPYNRATALQPTNPNNAGQPGQVLIDQNRPPLPSPVNPETAAATLRIPDDATTDQLWHTGTAYFGARRFPEASGYFFKGASEGDPRAASALGNMYITGEGVIRDPRRAVFYLEKGASAGNRGAQYSLGKLYEHGLGVRKSQTKAVALYTASAQQSYAPAAKSLALDYEFGRGVNHDRSQAIYWMKQAATNGDQEARVLTSVLTSPQAPRFKNERQLAAYVRSGGRTISSSNRSQRERQYSSYQNRAEPGVQTSPQQSQQPTAEDIREYNAAAAMMRQGMGFGGIFGSGLNNLLNPPKR
jgi:TPR repeat protein